MALITLAQLKSQLNILSSESKYDAKLNLYLGAASDWVESYCGRKFAAKAYVELIHGNRSNMINPTQFPIISIAELRISSSRDWSSVETLIDPSNYERDAAELGVFLYDQYFPYGFNNIRLSYTAGYETVPSDLQLACLWAAEWFYLHNTRGDQGRTGTSKQGESISILADVPAMIKSILQSYKRIDLPTTGLAVKHL